MKKRLLIGSGLLIVIVAVVAIIASFSFAEPLENHVKVEENSELTYYIDVSYDGRDSTATTSSDSATAEVYSDYIYVEDKLPEGLTFVDFVQTEDGTIGATKRSDGTFCAGYVEDGVAGLSYDPDTRTVSFRVKNLKAGCKLTVGIITRTPKLASGQTRMDFYNTAFARENNFYFCLRKNSNHGKISHWNRRNFVGHASRRKETGWGSCKLCLPHRTVRLTGIHCKCCR